MNFKRLERAFQAVLERDRVSLNSIELRKHAISKTIAECNALLKNNQGISGDCFENLLRETAFAQHQKQRILILEQELRSLEIEADAARILLRQSFGKFSALQSLTKLQSKL